MKTIAITWKNKLLKLIVFSLCLLPFAFLFVGAINNDLGANPLEKVTHTTGDWTLRLLLMTLAMSPLKSILKKAWPIKIRRMLGLFVFFYASLHFLTWAWLDQQFMLQAILEDIVKRPYVTVGFLAWLLLLPLALTSNKWSIRKLGKRWKVLHKSIYAIAVLGVLHFIWLVKADLYEPTLYGIILLLLMMFRWKGSQVLTVCEGTSSNT